jgi:enamine deaminase RidA (YjgF/YER057c/UK114 family)
MSASLYGERGAAALAARAGRPGPLSPPVVTRPAGIDSTGTADHTVVTLGQCMRIALALTPRGRGPFREQASEVLARQRAILAQQPQRMSVTCQTVFLREARDEAVFTEAWARCCGPEVPVTSFVLQPPCGGAGLALEAWAVGGPAVRVERCGPHAVAVSYDGLRWVHCGGVRAPERVGGAYEQTVAVLEAMKEVLAGAGTGLDRVVRTWFYLGGITAPEGEGYRYQQLNRARADAYRGVHFGHPRRQGDAAEPLYPASTGIGMAGDGLVMSCLALDTQRQDVGLLPLENPQQTPAYAYDPQNSGRSPTFSRAMALVTGDCLTTWISGTASIVTSESCHPADIEKQTEQTIENIERLIAPANFEAHGVPGAGNGLRDLTRVRVYLKRAEHLARCRAICQGRFGAVPTTFAVADVCRPELLVEIEGAAFSRCAPLERPGAATPG